MGDIPESVDTLTLPYQCFLYTPCRNSSMYITDPESCCWVLTAGERVVQARRVTTTCLLHYRRCLAAKRSQGSCFVARKKVAGRSSDHLLDTDTIWSRMIRTPDLTCAIVVTRSSKAQTDSSIISAKLTTSSLFYRNKTWMVSTRRTATHSAMRMTISSL